MINEGVFAHFAHWHAFIILPVEQITVEGERGFMVTGNQLVPATMPRSGGVKRLRIPRTIAPHNVEDHALRIGDHRVEADAGNISRIHMNGAAE